MLKRLIEDRGRPEKSWRIRFAEPLITLIIRKLNIEAVKEPPVDHLLGFVMACGPISIRTLSPAIREWFQQKDVPFAPCTPPVDHQLVIARQTHVGQASGGSPAFASKP